MEVVSALLGLGFGVLLICAAIWLLPMVLIAVSDRTTGVEKLAWLLLMLFVSWFAWIFYLLLAPLKPSEPAR